MRDGQLSAVAGLKPVEVLLDETRIQSMVKRLAAEITRDYAGKEILMICVLKGSFVFMSDLVREIDLHVQTEFMAVSSYQGSKSTGVVRILKDVDQDISDKHVIVVEDIVDTGLTLQKLTELLSTRRPASLELCTAFDKPSRRKVDIDVRYKGIEIPDRFVVGYGLDYDGHYRNLHQLYVLGDEQDEVRS